MNVYNELLHAAQTVLQSKINATCTIFMSSTVQECEIFRKKI